MDEHNQSGARIWLRAIGHTCLIISALILLYQLFMYLRFGAWRPIGIMDMLIFLEKDPVYWLPKEAEHPLLHKSLIFLLRAPIWITGVVVAIVIWAIAGKENKDEAI